MMRLFETRQIEDVWIRGVCMMGGCTNRAQPRWCNRHQGSACVFIQPAVPRVLGINTPRLRGFEYERVINPGVCEWCEFDAPHDGMIQRDHVLPRSEGGVFREGGNMQWLCLNCHYIKSREDDVRYGIT